MQKQPHSVEIVIVIVIVVQAADSGVRSGSRGR